jgi:hypothetical protein
MNATCLLIEKDLIMHKSLDSAKRRMMFIQKEDYNYLVYNIILILQELGCCSENKKFADYRKLAYIIDFIGSNDALTRLENSTHQEPYDRNDIQVFSLIYKRGIIKKKLISHLLLIMENQKYISVSINDTRKTYDISLNLDGLPKGFTDKKLFKNEICNIKRIKKINPRLSSIKLGRLLKNQFTDNGVLTWGI